MRLAADRPSDRLPVFFFPTATGTDERKLPSSSSSGEDRRLHSLSTPFSPTPPTSISMDVQLTNFEVSASEKSTGDRLNNSQVSWIYSSDLAASLMLSNTRVEDSGIYKCLATNSFGQETYEIRLDVLCKPAFVYVNLCISFSPC
ncbi:unnamed protein product [Protopolystoma xenopodis]|uniref:Ig-like domain-containing protein n=1 Tax=Protopolystoma xenopodis TaxID=117903 RepID=A0A3S5FCE7_9PLAT|nr:unnamed protein product [Protopolystoma xenopodis]